MNNLPSGTVTFLFTDIEGSMKLALQYPDEMPALLARHHEILRRCIQDHHGFVFEIVGDSFSAAFHSANDALQAALLAQNLLQNEAWSPAPIKVRMGIHTGAAELIDDSLQTGYSGYATLALTQRIMSVGHGGQILLSGATRELVRDALPVDSDLSDLGERRLKDLLRPEHVYQLNAFGLPRTFPPLKTLDLFPNNLPIQLTTFIGREHEILEIKQELNTHRLVTLTGSGGTGKTRLSLQVAAELLDRFQHGVWFVELAPLADPEYIPQTILSVIGIREQTGKTSLETLKEYLHEKNALLVLDNCEHLIEASAKVTDALLNAAPALKIMASSREALGVKGELSYPVPSLASPDIKHLPVVEQLSQYEAVRLFIDRACLVSPHFDVDQHNAPFIAQICYRLDGIPLAIELAAARVKVMSVEQISRRLDDRFRLLTGGARTALPRQQTLRALIDWSYDLLSEQERLLLVRLSVFAGGWTLEAAEEVCAGQGMESYDVLDLLTQLVNKSLVHVLRGSSGAETRESAGGSLRYRMLETVRQYAREKLLEVSGGEMIRGRHLAYFVKLAEQAEPELYRSHQLQWLNRLEDELDNLRMALEWSFDTDVESGLRIATLPWRFWQSRGYLREIGKWLAQLLERYPTVDALHAQALAITSISVFRQGDFPEAIRIAEQSLHMARTLSDRGLEAFSLSWLGVFTLLQGNWVDGIVLLEQSLALYRDLGDKIGQANTMEWLSVRHSNLERALFYAGESQKLYRELGDASDMANGLCTVALLTMWNGDFSSPGPWLEEARSIARQLGDQFIEAYALSVQGRLAHWRGEYAQAHAYYEETIALNEKTGYHYITLWTHANQAYTFLEQGEVERARQMFAENIRGMQKADLIIGLVYAIEGVASLHVSQGQTARAACLFAWADAMREKMTDLRPPIEQACVERDLEIIHAGMNDLDFSRLCSEGQNMTVDEAVTLALKE